VCGNRKKGTRCARVITFLDETFSSAAAARTHCVRPTARRPFPVCSRKKSFIEKRQGFAARSGPTRRKRESSGVVTTLRGSFRRILPSSTIRRCYSLGHHPFNIVNGTSDMVVRSCERRVPGSRPPHQHGWFCRCIESASLLLIPKPADPSVVVVASRRSLTTVNNNDLPQPRQERRGRCHTTTKKNSRTSTRPRFLHNTQQPLAVVLALAESLGPRRRANATISLDAGKKIVFHRRIVVVFFVSPLRSFRNGTVA
jgi:hypothetical protein